MRDIDHLVEFIAFSNKLKEVKRILYTRDNPHQENDAEHSFQLALTAWYIIDSRKLDLNLNKILMYSIAHDLVEIYAGDTYAINMTREMIENKKHREEEAFLKIKSEFPKFAELHSTISEYEMRDNPESRFVYALDKLLPMINIYLDNGAGWKERRETFDVIMASKAPKITGDPEIKRYFDKLVAIIEKDKDDFFHQS